MKVESVIKKVESALGIKVQQNGQQRYVFHCDGQVGSFRSTTSGSASGFHVRREGDYTNSQVDYFAGMYFDNCTQMIRAIRSPPPKFAEGSLLRVKSNKRSIRNSDAGRIGIVTSVSSDASYQILWCDTNDITVYFFERDLEIV